MQTIQTVRHMGRKHQPLARCAGTQKQQASLSSFGTLADGFLKHQFLPLFEQGKETPNADQAEKGFFDSLNILTGVYGFEQLEVACKPYPYNILLAHQYAQRQLKKSGQDIELAIMQDVDGTVKLATTHSYNTGTTLYYIPVLPLYHLLQDKKQKQTAELLLSVFSYLYHIAGIPYYRESHTYLFYQYECMEEWIIDDLESDENHETSEFNQASYYGDVMLRKIYNPYHLNVFKQRIATYKPKSSFGRDCLDVVQKAFALLTEYPNASIFRNTLNQERDEEDNIIHAEQYISFIADSDGLLYENIARVVNDEFNECGEIEEPTIQQIYDNQNSPSKEALDFEYRIFPLINELCSLLNHIP
ncbi:hypothetical protein OIU83_01215 [Flavobacterium sp. LS1R49]|uniref:Uncharacterized protein n=1 Tax=Flavobacterium shii TaxID=2987687 RepID=A0A9X2Z9Z5_9FLAO|nr:hypothetical protein [Flavobacterium shii]MCV9926255.1 hypothetical protein [Flavobacterium shii]